MLNMRQLINRVKRIARLSISLELDKIRMTAADVFIGQIIFRFVKPEMQSSGAGILDVPVLI